MFRVTIFHNIFTTAKNYVQFEQFLDFSKMHQISMLQTITLFKFLEILVRHDIIQLSSNLFCKLKSKTFLTINRKIAFEISSYNFTQITSDFKG